MYIIYIKRSTALQKYKDSQSKSVPFGEAKYKSVQSPGVGIRQRSVNWSIHAWVAKTLGTIHCDRRLVARWKYLPKKMYCSGVGHGLSTLEHMGCFISELDVCARWQVAWRGGEETRGERQRGSFM